MPVPGSRCFKPRDFNRTRGLYSLPYGLARSNGKSGDSLAGAVPAPGLIGPEGDLPRPAEDGVVVGQRPLLHVVAAGWPVQLLGALRRRSGQVVGVGEALMAGPP
jgi:hypothetical protein